MAAGGPPRRQLHGYISTDARDGWYRFAEQHGTNVTALLEAFGLLLADHASTKAADLPPLLAEVVTTGQAVASRRSSRRRE